MRGLPAPAAIARESRTPIWKQRRQVEAQLPGQGFGAEGVERSHESVDRRAVQHRLRRRLLETGGKHKAIAAAFKPHDAGLLEIHAVEREVAPIAVTLPPVELVLQFREVDLFGEDDRPVDREFHGTVDVHQDLPGIRDREVGRVDVDIADGEGDCGHRARFGKPVGAAPYPAELRTSSTAPNDRRIISAIAASRLVLLMACRCLRRPAFNRSPRPCTMAQAAFTSSIADGSS